MRRPETPEGRSVRLLRVGEQVLRAQSNAPLSVAIGERLYGRIRPEHCQIVAGGAEGAG